LKLVKEHINFQRGLDPKKAMDIGISRKLAYMKAKREINDTFKELIKKYGGKIDVHLDVEPLDIRYAYSASITLRGSVFFIGASEYIDGYEVGVELNISIEERVVKTIEEVKKWLIKKIDYMKAWKMI
jgi:hypothetical protein